MAPRCRPYPSIGYYRQSARRDRAPIREHIGHGRLRLSHVAVQSQLSCRRQDCAPDPEGPAVKALFPDRRFAGFGPSRLTPDPDPPPIHGVTARRATALRARVRERCPRRPGVYGMVDRDGRLIYVGKAKCLRSRLLSYFRAGSREAKAGRIIDHTRAVVWEFAPSEFAALLRELELIRRWRPNYNVLGLPGRQRVSYVCLGRKPAPYLFLSRQPTA